MTLTRPLRTLLCCTVLQAGAFLGVPMRPEHVPDDLEQQRTPVAMRATGTFDVKVVPQGAGETVDGIALGRMSLDKQFHGSLDDGNGGHRRPVRPATLH